MKNPLRKLFGGKSKKKKEKEDSDQYGARARSELLQAPEEVNATNADHRKRSQTLDPTKLRGSASKVKAVNGGGTVESPKNDIKSLTQTGTASLASSLSGAGKSPEDIPQSEKVSDTGKNEIEGSANEKPTKDMVEASKNEEDLPGKESTSAPAASSPPTVAEADNIVSSSEEEGKSEDEKSKENGGNGESSKEKAGTTDDEKETSGKDDEKDESIPPAIKSYDEIPVLEQTKLPRGGVSIETKAVGRVQFGIPPETIKDSMKLGIPVPQVYIVPVERFCREMGPALGVNLAEFEFPAYFNFFVYKKRCTLVVDSEDAEENIRRVFSETLLGPAQFLREENPITYEQEDFDPAFPKEKIPNFQKELQHFRIMPDGKELVIETLLDFCHFENRPDGHSNLGIPPSGDDGESSDDDLQILEELDDEAGQNEESVPEDENALEKREKKKKWTYSQTRFMGEVAVAWPPNATEEQIKNRSVPRVEIFKMPGGTEYIIHDVDVENHIIGRARVNGNVKVSENLRVDGFGGLSILDDIMPQRKKSGKGTKEKLTNDSEESFKVDKIMKSQSVPRDVPPPTFHPPSFGVTVLGNSHGFDASGSVSGYVLWINGRGVMIDPPPYSSATLEREGIRPRTIVGIILTHCHADHDAGAFQKVLTGSPVVVITTPTIYKSFIRKYAALSTLSPALLRHSHRYKPAIIGQPLRFQGATFYFRYSLHTIPCIGFRVEWRGRSMVFTADHFNSPKAIDKLEETGVLSKGRADDIRDIPLQDTDLLLHEAGAPPIHTPLDVLLELPPVVKKRLYVVHTAKLPDDCELKAAPTGTAGTLRLDRHIYSHGTQGRMERTNMGSFVNLTGSADDVGGFNPFTSQGEYDTIEEEASTERTIGRKSRPSHGFKSSVLAGSSMSPAGPPLVAMRPSSSTDAWFILNLMSAVPFISSLSYTSTMELLETARVDAYRQNDVVVPASRRSGLLCVVWEGTCAEKEITSSSTESDAGSAAEDNPKTIVWHAGDWTGPIVLQPDRQLSGESKSSKDHDIVAVSYEGVKVITIEFQSLHAILKGGSPLYQKYLERLANQERARKDIAETDADSVTTTDKLLDKALKELNVLELLNCNSALRKLNAVQKRHLESLAEGPISFKPNERMWQAGAPVDRAFIIVSGTASFQIRRSASIGMDSSEKDQTRDHTGDLQVDAMKVIKELDKYAHGQHGDDYSSMASVSSMEEEKGFPFELFGSHGGLPNSNNASFTDSKELEALQRGLKKRAMHLSKDGGSVSSEVSQEEDSLDAEGESQLAHIFTDEDAGTRSRRSSVIKRRGSRARFANKVLGRLYNRRAFTSGLVFSRGHFLGDVFKMVAGLLAGDTDTQQFVDDQEPSYGFGDKAEEDEKVGTIQEQEGLHSSTLYAGKDGCIVLMFQKTTLIQFLDAYPGFLLSLLGTQVVV